MAGLIKKMLDAIIAERSQGYAALVSTTKTKLLLKGINPDLYTDDSADDPAIISKIRQFADEMKIKTPLG